MAISTTRMPYLANYSVKTRKANAYLDLYKPITQKSKHQAIPCFAYPDAYLSSIPKHLDLPFTTPSQSYSLQLLPKQRMNPTREAYVGYSNPKEKTYSSIEFFLPKSPSMPIGHFPYYSSINE